MVKCYACSEEKKNYFIHSCDGMTYYFTNVPGDLKTVNKEHFKIYVINDVSSVP